MRRLIMLGVLFLVSAGPAFADTWTEVGALGGIAVGTHVGADNPSPVSGVVPAAVIEFTQHVDRYRLHIEGLPQITASGSASGPLGHSSASLFLVNTTVMADIDPLHIFRAGAGYQLIDLNNKNGSNGSRNASRVTSPLFALGATLPLPDAHFIELNANIVPNLNGVLLIFNADGSSGVNKPEQGAEIDYSAAYGWRRGNIEYLAGYRGISYHTRNLNNGELVDRNVGGAATFEVRFELGK
jgi:hypothetical protein